ncbi:MAG: hypothetical protein ABIO67_08920, partial [Mycobacteriales bacterium]
GFALGGYTLFGMGYIGYMTFVVALLREQGSSALAVTVFYGLLAPRVRSTNWSAFWACASPHRWTTGTTCPTASLATIGPSSSLGLMSIIPTSSRGASRLPTWSSSPPTPTDTSTLRGFRRSSFDTPGVPC